MQWLILLHFFLLLCQLTEEVKSIILSQEVNMEKFNAIYEEVDGGWIGYVEELPGANTQGKHKKRCEII